MPTDPNTLLGGTQDNGSPATATATTSLSWGNVLGGDGGYNAIDPNTDNWFASNPDTGGGTLNIQECSSGVNCDDGLFQVVVSSSSVGGDDGSFYFPYILDPQSTTLVARRNMPGVERTALWRRIHRTEPEFRELWHGHLRGKRGQYGSRPRRRRPHRRKRFRSNLCHD